MKSFEDFKEIRKRREELFPSQDGKLFPSEGGDTNGVNVVPQPATPPASDKGYYCSTFLSPWDAMIEREQRILRARG